MTYAQMAGAAENRARGALILTRRDGKRLQVHSMPELGLTNLTAPNPNGTSTRTCTDQATTLRTVREWYEGRLDYLFYAGERTLTA